MLYDLACQYTDTTAWTCKEGPVTTIVQNPTFKIIDHGVLSAGQDVSLMLAVAFIIICTFVVGFVQGQDRQRNTVDERLAEHEGNWPHGQR